MFGSEIKTGAASSLNTDKSVCLGAGQIYERLLNTYMYVITQQQCQ